MTQLLAASNVRLQAVYTPDGRMEMKTLLVSDSRQQTADSRRGGRLLSAVCCLLSFTAACASAPPPPSLQIQISGQVIDRQFREVVVTIINDGAASLHDVPVEIDVPAGLAIIREAHEGGLELHTEGGGKYRYIVRQLQPGARATARFPFRRETSAALAGADVRVVAANVKSQRTFPE
jgi:hypothetical protein